MTTPLRLLIVEDMEGDARLLRLELERGGFAPEHQRVDSAEALAAALADRDWDLALTDYAMPGFSGIAAVRLIRELRPDLPVIMVSGMVDEDIMEEAIGVGAQACLSKERLEDLGPMVQRVLSKAAARPPAAGEIKTAPTAPTGPGQPHPPKSKFHRTIKGKLLMGFLATNLLLLMVAAGAIYKAYDNAKNSALINAELSIKVLALLIADEDESHLGKTPLFATPTRLQHIIEDVQSLKTDLVVVDRSKKIVADTIKANVGTVFQHDLGNEVGLTMEDRKVRTFLERSIDYPEGIQQMVVPLITAHTGQNIGALIMDYTQEYRQAMDIARNLALTMGVISLLCIVSGIGIGFLVYRGITRDVRRLKDAACTLAEGDLATPIGGIPGELGSVAAALEETRQKLAAAREIVANGLAERTRAEAALTQAHEKMTGSLGQIRRRNREMAVLSELGELLQTVDQTSEALPLVNRFMPRLFPQWSGALYMLDNSKVMLEPAVVWGGEAPDLSVFHPDECWGLRRGRPHVVEDPAVGLCCPHSEVSCRDRRPYLCMPLTTHGEALGLIHLHRDLAAPKGQAGPISDDLQRLAGTVADQLALSLSNLKLRESLHRQSIRDQLTGLFNRRYLDETLVREVSRAKRTNTPLGVIMLDIDHFKQFNDSFGHEASDLVLRHLGEFLQTQVRREDMACRYGGEEFTLILPGASLSATRERAEILRQGVQRLQLRYGAQDLGTVTVSLGVAVYPEHGVSPEAVLQAADAAMYAAKQAGRNRVMAAEGVV